MRRVIRLLIVSGVAVAPLLPVNAWADDGSGATTGGYIDPSGDPTVTAGSGGHGAGGGSSSSGGSDCEWRVAIADDDAFPLYEPDGTRLQSPTGRWLLRWCDGQIVSDLVPEQPAVDPAVLAAQARDSIPIPSPVIGTSPSSGGGTYAQVRTWLWVDDRWWQERTATASAGGVSATVTATPVQTSWTTGDGDTFTCPGPGVVWRPGMAEDATDCSHIYRRSSAGELDGQFAVTVTVQFDVRWTSSLGTGGTLDGVNRSASTTLRVGEIQAIEVE